METENTVHGNTEWQMPMDGEGDYGRRESGWSMDDAPWDGEERQTPSPGRHAVKKSFDEHIPADYDAFKRKLENTIGLGKSVDVQLREFPFGETRIAFLFLSVFTKDDILTEVLMRLSYVNPYAVTPEQWENLLATFVPAMQIRKTESWAEMLDEVLMGNTALYISGLPAALLIDAKQFPARQPELPETEKVVRGSKDGFTETLLVNMGLIRRRLRDQKVRFEIMKVGQRTQTDVCIGYIEDITNPKLLESVRDKIKKVQVDGIPLADKQLEEMMIKRGWSPFPMVRYTERPDVVAAHLLDGSVAVLTDTSPSVMLLPTTFFDLVQHAEENRQNPFMGTYLRWIRFIGILASLFILPLWYLFAQHTSYRPDWLWFVGPDETGDLPLILQFIIAEIGMDLLRLASVHTPSPLVTAMTLFSAILIGEIAVKTGLFVNEVILYMAVAAVGMFATPSYELGLANRIVRLALLIAVFLFQVPGFVVATTLLFIYLAMERSFNIPYLWPLVPFNGPALLSILLRRPMPANKKRPSHVRPLRIRKQPV